jgi:type IV pilus assembly protein PilA
MKTEFKAKFLNHMSQRKKGDKGFTLIELLVVIIIIGILAAIALPAFLNQANKAKQSEAKTTSGSMNRSQQAYYLEKGEFIFKDTDEEFAKLGLGVSRQTSNYDYKIAGIATQVTNQGRPRTDSGAPPSVKAYIGGVKVGTVTGTGEATTLVVLCEADKAPVATGSDGAIEANYASIGTAAADRGCPGGFSPIK